MAKKIINLIALTFALPFLSSGIQETFESISFNPSSRKIFNKKIARSLGRGIDVQIDETDEDKLLKNISNPAGALEPKGNYVGEYRKSDILEAVEEAKLNGSDMAIIKEMIIHKSFSRLILVRDEDTNDIIGGTIVKQDHLWLPIIDQIAQLQSMYCEIFRAGLLNMAIRSEVLERLDDTLQTLAEVIAFVPDTEDINSWALPNSTKRGLYEEKLVDYIAYALRPYVKFNSEGMPHGCYLSTELSQTIFRAMEECDYDKPVPFKAPFPVWFQKLIQTTTPNDSVQIHFDEYLNRYKNTRLFSRKLPFFSSSIKPICTLFSYPAPYEHDEYGFRLDKYRPYLSKTEKDMISKAKKFVPECEKILIGKENKKGNIVFNGLPDLRHCLLALNRDERIWIKRVDVGKKYSLIPSAHGIPVADAINLIDTLIEFQRQSKDISELSTYKFLQIIKLIPMLQMIPERLLLAINDKALDASKERILKLPEVQGMDVSYIRNKTNDVLWCFVNAIPSVKKRTTILKEIKSMPLVDINSAISAENFAGPLRLANGYDFIALGFMAFRLAEDLQEFNQQLRLNEGCLAQLNFISDMKQRNISNFISHANAIPEARLFIEYVAPELKIVPELESFFAEG